MAQFRWTGRREEAALLIAEDRLTNKEIAAKVGVVRQSIREWKQYPEFMARVESHVAAMAEAARERGIANRERRIAALNDRWRRMLRLIEDRAQEMASVPGGQTGLLVKQVKLIKVRGQGTRGQGTAGQLALWEAPEGETERPDTGTLEVAEYVLDGVLLKELREHEKQAAMEVGQWEQPEPPVDVLVMTAEEALLELQAAEPSAKLLEAGHSDTFYLPDAPTGRRTS